MATSPITIAWASTTSNKLTIDATTQGNGIVFESDVVSNLINTALYINSQATRNLQVMGGYYDAGQDYKNYQYCSQLAYVGNEYVLNFYMATQDTPTLAPTNATSFQQNTTDMQVPINPTSVQSGWQKIKFIPNQDNLVFTNTDNTFTGSNTFEGTSTFTGEVNLNGNTNIGDSDSDTCTIQATTTIANLSDSTLKSGATFDVKSGKIKVGGVTIDGSQSLTSDFCNIETQQYTSSYILGQESGKYIVFLPSAGGGIRIKDPNSIRSFYLSPFGGSFYAPPQNAPDFPYVISAGFGTSLTGTGSSGGSATHYQGIRYGYSLYDSSSPTTPVARNAIVLRTNVTTKKCFLSFDSTTTITNASFGGLTYALDPQWEQDYATANYVNQKSLDLYEEIDARLSAIEEKLGIPKVASRGVDIKTRLASMEVAKSPITELFEKINNTQGYEGVLEQSDAEERLALSQVRDDETEVMKIVNSIKDRIEREAKEREEAEAQRQSEQTQESSPKTRTRTKS